MAKTLTKSWNRAEAGTVITADPAEVAEGAVLVDPARFAYLEAQGFFASQPEGSFADAFANREAEGVEREIVGWDPGESILPSGADKGGRNSPPETPRPNSRPLGQGIR